MCDKFLNGSLKIVCHRIRNQSNNIYGETNPCINRGRLLELKDTTQGSELIRVIPVVRMSAIRSIGSIGGLFTCSYGPKIMIGLDLQAEGDLSRDSRRPLDFQTQS